MFLILDQSPTAFSLRLRNLAERKGLKTILLTSAEIAREVVLGFHLSDKDLGLHLRHPGAVIETGDIRGVYCGINVFEPALWDKFAPGDAEYAARETQALWLAILASLPCRVVNPPALDSLAGTLLSTPEILYLAHRLGFFIPMVITLESGKVAAEVLKTKVPARYADLGKVWVNETDFSRDDLASLEHNEDHFRVLEEIPGKAVYVTLLGDHFFACEVNAAGYGVPLPVRQIPRLIRSRLRTLNKRQNLVLAEYSLRVMADGNWAFLGCARPSVFAVAAYGDALLGQVIDYIIGKRE